MVRDNLWFRDPGLEVRGVQIFGATPGGGLESLGAFDDGEYYPCTIAVGDLDGDGLPDVATGNGHRNTPLA